MVTQPTIELFSEFLDDIIACATEELGRALAQARLRLGRDNAQYSSRALHVIFDIAHKEYNAALDRAFGALKQANEKSGLNTEELRSITESKLREFAESVKQMNRAEKLPQACLGTMGSYVGDQLLKFDKRLDFLLRQFDAGFYEPACAEIVAPMKNTINISNMDGGAIQQGTQQSTQNISIQIDQAQTLSSLREFENALSELKINQDTMASVQGDIDTIKAQLAKPNPSESIILEAGRSLKNVVENVIAGVLTPPVSNAAAALWAALSL